MLENKKYNPKEIGHIYQTLFVNNVSVILIIDVKSARIVDANKAAIAFYGYPDLIGRLLDDIESIPHTEIIKALSFTFCNQSVSSLRTHHTVSGIVKHVEVHSEALVLDGQDLVYSVLCDSVKEKTKSEDLARLYQAIIQSPGPVAMTDILGVLTFVNPAFSELSGYSEEELIGSPTRILNSGVRDSRFYTEMWDTIKNGKVWSGEFINRNKQGEKYIEQARIAPIIDEYGIIISYVKVSRDVTYEREVEKKLEASRNLFKEILENMPGGYMMIDRNFKIVQVNKQVCEITGFTSEELLNKSCSLLCAREYPKKQCPFYTQGLSSSAGMDTTLKCKDGRVVPILKNARFIEVDNEKFLIENFQDITELKKTEHELLNEKKASEQLRADIEGIIENTLSCVWAVDTDLRLTYFNQVFFNNLIKIFGIKLEIGDVILDVIPEKYNSFWLDCFQRALRGEQFVFDRALGEGENSIYFNILISPIFKQKKVVGISFFASDITQRKKEENDLLEAKKEADKAKKKIEHQNYVIKKHNERLEGLLRIADYSSNSVQNLLDFSLKEVLSLTESKIAYIYSFDNEKRQFSLQSWLNTEIEESNIGTPKALFNFDDVGCLAEVIRQQKYIISNDHVALRPFEKEGRECYFKFDNYLIIPIYFENEIVAVCGVANKLKDYVEEDVRQLKLMMESVWRISERLSLMEELKKAKEAAEQSDRLKTAFLANMSHEIRTPMNGIMGFTSLISKSDLNNTTRSKYIANIMKSGNRMLNTVNDIIEISKIEVGEVNVKKDALLFTDTLNDIYEFFKSEVEAKGLHLVLDMPDDIKSLTINTDKTKIESIITNLVKNAIKYSDSGTIHLGYYLAEDRLNFYCNDEGIGIPQNRLQSIFNRFEQADIEDARAFQGSGLGLAITKAYIEMLGGEITVSSREGQGSEFQFSIPIEVMSKVGVHNNNNNNNNISAV